MATQTKAKKMEKSPYQAIKKTTKKLNETIYEVSAEIVDGTLESSEQWQGLLEKGLKGGTKLMQKQQDFMIDTLAAVKGQAETDLERYTKLFGFDKFSINRKDLVKSLKAISPKWVGRVEKTVDYVSKTTTETLDKVVETADKVMDAVEERAEDAIKSAKKLVNSDIAPKAKAAAKKVTKTTPKVKVVAKKASPKAAVKKATKAAPKTVKTAVAKVTAKKEAIEKTVATKVQNDLKVIDGIGPKMEQILNEAGIKNLNDIKNSKVEDLRAILDKAGNRYKMFNPQLWINQANNA